MPKYQTPIGIIILIVGAIFLPVPFFSNFYLLIYLAIYLPYLLYLIYLDLTGKNKNVRLRAYGGYWGLLLFSISFGTPAVKLYDDNLIVLGTIIAVWLLLILLVNQFKDVVYSIVFPDGKYSKIYSIIFHGFIAIVILAGGGGFYKAPEYFSNEFGSSATMAYFSIVLLLASYWMAVFAQSTTKRFKGLKK